MMDPNRKEREEEEKLRKDVKASKKQWRRCIRQERFLFLDADMANAKKTSKAHNEEKKQNQPRRGVGSHNGLYVCSCTWIHLIQVQQKGRR